MRYTQNLICEYTKNDNTTFIYTLRIYIKSRQELLHSLKEVTIFSWMTTTNMT